MHAVASTIHQLEVREMAKADTTRDFLTDNDIMRITEEGLDQGKTKQEILEELSLRHDRKEYLAQIITRIPDPALKRRYKAPNQVLVVLLIVLGMLNLGMLLLAIFSRARHLSAFDAPAIPLLMMLFVASLHKMRSPVHRPLALISLVGILHASRLMPVHPIWSFVNIALLITIGGLLYYIGPRLFPNAGFMGPRKDENGNYVL